jgi:hypothetical protein
MNTLRIHAAVPATLILGLLSTHAHAGCENSLQVTGHPNSTTIHIYDSEGHKTGDIPKDLAVNQLSQECNESLGLVKITLTDKREVWVSRTEAKRIAGKADMPVCTASPPAKAPDTKFGATNGIDPGCTPKQN